VIFLRDRFGPHVSYAQRVSMISRPFSNRALDTRAPTYVNFPFSNEDNARDDFGWCVVWGVVLGGVLGFVLFVCGVGGLCFCCSCVIFSNIKNLLLFYHSVSAPGPVLLFFAVVGVRF